MESCKLHIYLKWGSLLCAHRAKHVCGGSKQRCHITNALSMHFNLNIQRTRVHLPFARCNLQRIVASTHLWIVAFEQIETDATTTVPQRHTGSRHRRVPNTISRCYFYAAIYFGEVKHVYVCRRQINAHRESHTDQFQWHFVCRWWRQLNSECATSACTLSNSLRKSQKVANQIPNHRSVTTSILV